MRTAPTAMAILFLFALDGSFAAKKKPPDADEANDNEVEITLDQKDGDTTPPPDALMDFCFFSGRPTGDVQYTVIKKVKVGKGTYGGVKDILPKLAARARGMGADAIVDYTGSQRFGFWPWRMVRPVVRGVAVRWNAREKPDCAAIGGSTLQSILAIDEPPPQQQPADQAQGQ